MKSNRRTCFECPFLASCFLCSKLSWNDGLNLFFLVEWLVRAKDEEESGSLFYSRDYVLYCLYWVLFFFRAWHPVFSSLTSHCSFFLVDSDIRVRDRGKNGKVVATSSLFGRSGVIDFLSLHILHSILISTLFWLQTVRAKTVSMPGLV